MNILSHIFSYFILVFGYIACYLGLSFIFDAILSSFVFIFSGNWESILQTGFETTKIFSPEFINGHIWNVSTGLKGLDLLINEFLLLQFSVSGRWKMLGLAIVICLSFIVIMVLLNLKLKFKSSNPKTPDDMSLVHVSAMLTSTVMIFPNLMAYFVSVMLLISGIFGFETAL